MPGVLKYTPSWLSRPSPGFDFFAPKASTKLTGDKSKDESHFGPLKSIAHRGTEVFVAVGNELRWSDLVLLKEKHDEAQDRKNGQEEMRDAEDDDELDGGGADAGEDKDGQSTYRVLKVPISRPIRQLIISPDGDFLAIVTSHTIHVAILPDSSHLGSSDDSPIKLKTFHVGPTTHVLERSAIASVLWHPLSIKGGCLVTVTVDAVVRLWELDKDNRWSFDSPALAIDLVKLVDGHTSNEDFSPSKYGTSKGFSPDSFEMEVASACWGGSAAEGEDPWASMTLWVAMREGDVYALCPLLPSKWSAPVTLTSSLISAASCIASSDSTTNHSQSARNQLRNWISDVASQNPPTSHDALYDLQTFSRPLRPGAIPKLQGPFAVSPDMDDMFDVTNIYAVPAIDNDEVTPSEDGEIADELEPSSASLLCLATSDGKVHVLLEIGSIEGRWLPPRKLSSDNSEDEEVELLLVESLSLGDANDSIYPSFTQDPLVHHSVFVTHSGGVSYLDMSAWTSKLAEELESTDDAGVAFRVEMLLDAASTVINHPITCSTATNAANEISACIALSDSDLGFFVLTISDHQPQSATLTEPLSNFAASLREALPSTDPRLLLEYNPDAFDAEVDLPDVVSDARPPYQPPSSLWAASELTNFLDKHLHPRHRKTMDGELRLSPAVLNVMMDAHRVLSTETHALGFAVGDLFRRCERLCDEFREQIRRAREIRDRIDAVTEESADRYQGVGDQDAEPDDSAREHVEKRLQQVRDRQSALEERYNEVRRKLGRATGRPLSEKEENWMVEIKVVERMIGEDESRSQSNGVNGDTGHTPEDDESKDAEEDEDDSHTALPHVRYRQVKDLQRRLIDQAQDVAQSTSPGEQEDLSASFRSSITSRTGMVADRRRAAQAEIDMLLERQVALLEATKDKIGRLAGLGPAL